MDLLENYSQNINPSFAVDTAEFIYTGDFYDTKESFKCSHNYFALQSRIF